MKSRIASVPQALSVPSTSVRRRTIRRGVVLMIMLSLLAMFTVLAVTFVVASGQFRRGATAASRAEQTGDPFEVLLQQAMLQAVRGSNHPQSVIGPHSLLEDMYGQSDAVAGCIWKTLDQSEMNTDIVNDWETYSAAERPQSMLIKFVGFSFGWDLQPGSALADDDGNNVVDDVSEIGNGDDCFFGESRAHPLTRGAPPYGSPPVADSSLPIIDQIDNYYAGRVITFVTGPAAGQSCHIVRSKIYADGSSIRTVFWITPPDNGKQPQAAYMGLIGNDRFVINGRAFNGRGFGANPYTFDNDTGLPIPGPSGLKPPYADNVSGLTVPNPMLRMLDHQYYSPNDPVDTVDNTLKSLSGKQVPVAFTPNPVDLGMRDYLNRYAPFVEADEDYDAPDVQNMLLAYQQWNNRTGRFETIAPSLHRPDLVNYLMRHSAINPKFASLGDPANLGGDTDQVRWYHLPPSVRRRVILRPDPVDHYDYTQENVFDPAASNGWYPGEPFVDSNQNGQWDPYVSAINGAEQFTDQNSNGMYDIGDRPFFNPTFDAVTGPWDVDNDGDGVPDSIFVDIGLPVTTASDGRLVKPLVAYLVIDLDGRINLNAHGGPGNYRASDPYELSNLTGTPNTGIWNTPHDPSMSQPANPPLPQNITTITGRSGYVTTEERYLIGPYAFAISQKDNASGTNNNSRSTSDPIVVSGMYSGYGYSERWASAYPNDNFYYSAQQQYRDGNLLTLTSGQPLTDAAIPLFEPAFGQGWSPADVNVAAALWIDGDDLPRIHRRRRNSLTITPTNPSAPRINRVRELFEGKYNNASSRLVQGRYGEVNLLRAQWEQMSGYGNVPRAGSGLAVIATKGAQIMSAAEDDDIPALPSLTGSLFGSNIRENFPTGTDKYKFGDYGTPGDFQSRAAVGLDLNGNPIAVGFGGGSDAVNDPTEINLNRRYFPQMNVVGGELGAGFYDGANPNKLARHFADRDAPFTPAELERLLRSEDPNSEGISDRLFALAGGADNERYFRMYTTESWDLPCPHIAPTAELAAALTELGLPVGNPTLGDLLRARFYLAHGSNPSRCDALRAAGLATIAMRSYAYKYGSPSSSELQDNRSRLISPDLAIGLRMDINAPFGNGADDDNDNIVDEPGEGELSNDPAMDERLQVFNYVPNNQPPQLLNLLHYDGNRDGNAQPQTVNGYAGERQFEMPRSQYAKELYCLMILLIDEHYVMPVQQSQTSPPGITPVETDMEPVDQTAAGQVNFSSTLFPQLTDGATNLSTYFPGQEPENLRKAKRWLTARRIAQWAINAVDFRDRDSIMTPFEFDVDPFNDNDGASGSFNVHSGIGNNGTWDVDGDLTTDENDSSSGNWFRGVVWGCEYPDVLLSETVAFHDRRTANTMYEVEVPTDPDDPMSAITGTHKLCRTSPSGSVDLDDGGTPPKPYDKTWDQVAVPQGSAFIELYTTGNMNNPLQPQELYSDNKLDLGRLVVGDGSPVWRLAITKGRRYVPDPNTHAVVDFPQYDVARRVANNPGTCSLDPSNPGFSILPWVNKTATEDNAVMIERVVTFAGTPATATRGLNMDDSGNPWPSAKEIDVFTAREGVTEVPGNAYVVVGPYRGGGSLHGVTQIGNTTQTSLHVNGSDFEVGSSTQPEGVLAMINGMFIATSPNGVIEYPVFSYTSHWTALSTTLGGLTNTDTTRSLLGNQTATYDQIRRPYAISCAINGSLASFGGAVSPQTQIGLNISEPTNEERPDVYYKHADNGEAKLVLGPNPDAWNNALSHPDRITAASDSAADKVRQQYDDEPWDGYFDTSGNPVVYNPQLPTIKDSTTLRYKSVFLQRLADPTQPFHRITNPYITMDWMPFDLTIFNGEAYWIAPVDPDETDPDEQDRNKQLKAMTNKMLREGTWPVRDAPQISAGDEDESIRFGSRQRGGPRMPFKGNFSHFDLWSQPDWTDRSIYNGTLPPLTRPANNFRSPTDSSTDPGNDTYSLGKLPSTVEASGDRYYCKWQDPLRHTLGYINEPFHYQLRQWSSNKFQVYDNNDTRVDTPGGVEADFRIHFVKTPMTRPDARSATDTSAPKGWLMGCDFGNEESAYIGGPFRPYPWLTWNNRPYSGAMELLLVPASSQARLLHEYDMRRGSLPTGVGADTQLGSFDLAPNERTRSGNHYLPPVSASGAKGYVFNSPFGHLLNFFESSSADAIGPAPIAWSNAGPDYQQSYSAANFFRIFEFITVPSRFSGIRNVHRNGVFNEVYNMNGTYFTGNEHPAWPFTAPFNVISDYREPGRVNLNTLPIMANAGPGDAGAVAWRAVTNEFFPRMHHIGSREFKRADDVTGFLQYNTSPGATNSHPYNPSQTTVENFYGLLATMHSDDPLFDPRGPDGAHNYPSTLPTAESTDDTLWRAMSRRCDPQRAQLFNNPVRSFVENFGAVAPAIPNGGTTMQQFQSSLGEDYPLLAVDSTLLRRRDTHWSPWDTNQHWPPNDVTGPLFKEGQVDPAFDPLFALSFPRPYSVPSGQATRIFSAYSVGLDYYGAYSGAANFSRTADYRNSDRNPFFRYQLYSRLGNVATTRSNCYAIWVTLAYFEVEHVDVVGTALPSQEQSGYPKNQDLQMAYRFPGGYRMLRELGSESGDITRHKAFAIFDRSVPVGFMRGENLNVDQGFLIRRILY